MKTNITIKDMQKIAKERKGQCLSKVYVNTHTKLKWKCKNGHEFQAMPSNVKKGQWCKKCSREKVASTQRLSIEDMQNEAKKKGGKCLSKTYKNAHTKLIWECKEGHKWDAAPLNIRKGSWCPTCAGKGDIVLKHAVKKAKDFGGKLLSKKYKNGAEDLRWECKEGHKFKKSASKVKSGKWCPTCKKKQAIEARSDSIDVFKEIAKSRGGECLSINYKNQKDKLKFRCDKGHEFIKKPADVKRGQWCQECSKELAAQKSTKFDLNFCKALANKKQGKCLSKEYKRINNKLKWECKEGHVFEMTLGKVKDRNQWCPQCGNVKRAKNREKSIEEVISLVEERGGKLISKHTKGMTKTLNWECNFGHSFKMKPIHIKTGRWCPDCSKGISEKICRAYFESIFGKPFNSAWPKWLTNKEGNAMELDGYNEELKIAFEHQGRQHFEHVKFFHENEERLKKRKNDDSLKKRKCTLNGVKLIRIPQLGSMLKHDDVFTFLEKEFKKQSIHVSLKNITVDLSEVYKHDKLLEYAEIAENKGGKCLSSNYLGATEKYHWECEFGHKWWAKATNIKSGQWCPKCGGNERRTIDELEEIVKKNGGKLKTKVLKNSKEKVSIVCKKGHEWNVRATSVFRGTWCPACSAEERGVSLRKPKKFYSDFAKDKGGKLLEVLDDGKMYKFKCKEGHTWTTSKGSIAFGSWCPKCGAQRTSEKLADKIELFHKIAKERNGKCLSEEYINQKFKLKWQCEKGHIWEAIPPNIKKGHWCPDCSKIRQAEEKTKKTTEEAKRIAKKYGGKLLSKEVRTEKGDKVNWKCSKGHEFSRTITTIKANDVFCRICNKEKKKK